MAFAFDGSWKPIIAAILVGSIAKWLAKGFADHKNRVAIEADLVKRKKGNPGRGYRLSRITRGFLNAIAIAIRDLKLLPHDKQTILDAICWEIVDRRDDARLKSLRDAALFLADFAEGVGEEPLFLLGADLSSRDPVAATVEELMEIARQIADDPNRERYESFERLVQTSEDDILAKLAVAEMLRQQNLGNSKRAS